MSHLGELDDRYELLAKLGAGGMGAVYKVRHRLLGEIRVVKVMQPRYSGDDTFQARFLREAKVAAGLRHPNIAQVYDFEMSAEGAAYLILEYIDGIDLHVVLTRFGPPSLALTLEIARQSLNALGHLHARQLIHRDISPHNLMLTRDDAGNPLIKLIDLGIAKSVAADDASLTGTGLFLGKVHFASPEHFGGPHGSSVVDQRSDLYSFGIVLYQLLTGELPIHGDSHAVILASHLVHPPRSFNQTDPSGKVPERLRRIILKALEKDPGRRFQDAAEFTSALEAITLTAPLGPEALKTETQEIFAKTRRAEVDPELERGATRSDNGLRPPTGAPPRPDTTAITSQINVLLDNAHQLLELEQFLAAKIQLDTILSLDPENTTAQRLIADHAGLRQLYPDDSVKPPSTPTPAGLVDDTIAVPGTQRRQQLLSQARSDIAAGLLEHALQRLQAVLDEEPSNTAALALLEDTRRQLSKPKDLGKTPPSTAAQPHPPRVWPWVSAAAALAVITIVVAAFLLRTTFAPVTTGVLVIDATPWAEVTAVQSEDGQTLAIETPCYTPATLTLPAGVYSLVLESGRFGSKQVTVTVQQGATVSELVSFFQGSPEELLDSLGL